MAEEDVTEIRVTKEPAKKAGGVRARVRAELTAEIKASASRQLASHGASALSLRAIARELEMASSAIYRYFASRDELLTAMIIDAYNDMGSFVEDADALCERDDYHGRFVAIGTAIRRWAINNPHEYALIYGSPVPGYAAPEDTIDPAVRVSIALVSVFVEAHTPDAVQGEAEQGEPEEPDERLSASIEGLMAFTGHTISPKLLARAVEAWGEIFGLVSLELFGHFNNAISNPGDYFDHAVDSMATRVLA